MTNFCNLSNDSFLYPQSHLVLGLRKRFECSNLRLFAVHLKLNFSLRSFAATPTLMFAYVHLCNLNMSLIMWVCSRKDEALLLAASVSFLSPAMLNPNRNSKKNNTSTHKAIIYVLEALYSVRATLIKTHANLWILFIFSDKALFCNLHPLLNLLYCRCIPNGAHTNHC